MIILMVQFQFEHIRMEICFSGERLNIAPAAIKKVSQKLNVNSFFTWNKMLIAPRLIFSSWLGDSSVGAVIRWCTCWNVLEQHVDPETDPEAI